MSVTLFDYHRSSASYRVRIALRMKGIAHETVAVDLREGAQREDAYRAKNPQGLVPMLEIDGTRIAQSLAIIAYLEATRPEPPLLPADPADQAQVRAMALVVACDIHPLNNLRVLEYLKGPLGADDEARAAWYAHWVRSGFDALEQMARPHAGRFLFGDAPTLADICLVPQLYNARRFEVPIGDYELLLRAEAEANGLAAFAGAHPDKAR
ncbi:MAG: maleylacetoacetate isomerase [Sphingomonadaceae bacterium]